MYSDIGATMQIFIGIYSSLLCIFPSGGILSGRINTLTINIGLESFIAGAISECCVWCAFRLGG